MKKNELRSSLLILFLMAVSNVASAATSTMLSRCLEEQIGDHNAGRQRNAWAVKCGFARPAYVNELNLENEYIVFNEGNAPVDVNEPCTGDWTRQTTCRISCFTESQTVYFDKGAMTLKEAFESNDDLSLVVVTGVDKNKKAQEWSMEGIDTFISGKHKGLVYEFVLSNGVRVEVTKTHPMVMDDASVLPAKALSVGQSLLGIGGPTEIKEINLLPYDGMVWNVQPVSVEKERNIIVSQGILFGSARFQNQWADERSRLALRDDFLHETEL